MLLVVLSTTAALAVSIPIVYVVVRAFDRGWDGVEATLWRPRMLHLIWRSVSLAGAVTAATLVIGIGFAWLVTRTNLPWRGGWRIVLGIPLAIPSYVAAWSWIGWRHELQGFTGAWIVLTSISYPFVYLPVAAALSSADATREEVARSLGCGRWSTFWRVTLPHVRIAAVGGALLVALYVLSDFGAVSIMRYEALTHVIYRSYRAAFDRTPPAVLGCVLIVLSLIVVFAASRVQRHDRVARVGGGAPRRAVPVNLGRWRLPALALVGGFTLVTFGVPARTLTLWLARGRSTTDWGRWADAAMTTVMLAVGAALVTVLVALPIGMLTARYPGRWPRLITTLAYAGHSLPGIVVALAMIFFGIRVIPGLYQSTAMLVFTYVVLFVSLALGSIHHAIASSPPQLEEIARSLGRTQRQAWMAVTVRLAAPGIGAAAALVCLAVMKELPATLLLRPIETETLATRLWSHTDATSFAAAAPYAAAIVVLAAVPTAVLSVIGIGRGGGADR